LLDPRYAPPEKYIMSTSTPKAPPTPVAALLSPVLWQLNRPDRFDMYSVGILLVQMCFPALRRDNQLVAFNRTLEKLDYDILKWRDTISGKRLGGDYSTGIKILDLDNGRGWDLLRLLISNNPNKRIGASAAASHPFVSNSTLGRVPVILDQVGEMLPEDVQRQSEWLGDMMTGTTRVGEEGGGLTEAMVEDFRNRNRSSSSRSTSNVDVNAYDPNNSRTISWWQGRAGGNRKRRSFQSLFQIWSYKTTKTINSRSSSSRDSPSPSFFNLFNFNKKYQVNSK
jgi:serine/threonine protein kinase